MNNLIVQPFHILTCQILKNLTTKFTDFEAERLTFTDLEENERSKGQLIAYPRYNHPQLERRSSPIFTRTMDDHIYLWYSFTTEYYADDSQR